MRFMVIVKANKDSEAGVVPAPELFEAMGKFNEELVKAKVMLAGEGLLPTAKGTRIRFGGNNPAITQGPFPLTGDTIAGFWLIQAASMDEAVNWMKRAPFEGEEIEIRQVAEAEDFGEKLPAEVHEKEEELRRQIEMQKAS